MNIVKNPRPRRRGSRLLAAALAAVAATTGSAAMADTPSEVHVNLKDLNLRTPAGAQTLMRRIEVASTRVCGDPFVYDLGDRHRFRVCRAEAIGRAVRQADAPLLTDIAHGSAQPLTLAGS